MSQSNMKSLMIFAVLSFVLFMAACGEDETNASTEEGSEDIGAKYSEEMDYTITGLEPGAGQTELNNQAIEEYESLAGWEQQTSSTGAMLTALDTAIQNEEPIIITAWSPHYKFAKWDIKYLEDPKGIFGEEIYAATLTRLGFEEDHPAALEVIKNFYWDIDKIEETLLRSQEEELERDVLAEKWVEENEETVAEWTDGIEKGNGEKITVGATLWDEVLFTGNVAKIVLEQHGYDVEFTSLDPAILFESIASGDIDVTLAPWLPTTHGALAEEYEGEFVEVGKNIEGGKLGLAVPSYMEIDSLEDFAPAG